MFNSFVFLPVYFSIKTGSFETAPTHSLLNATFRAYVARFSQVTLNILKKRYVLFLLLMSLYSPLCRIGKEEGMERFLSY